MPCKLNSKHNRWVAIQVEGGQDKIYRTREGGKTKLKTQSLTPAVSPSLLAPKLYTPEIRRRILGRGRRGSEVPGGELDSSAWFVYSRSTYSRGRVRLLQGRMFTRAWAADGHAGHNGKKAHTHGKAEAITQGPRMGKEHVQASWAAHRPCGAGLESQTFREHPQRTVLR